jgi:hypothetical protein
MRARIDTVSEAANNYHTALPQLISSAIGDIFTVGRAATRTDYRHDWRPLTFWQSAAIPETFDWLIELRILAATF